MGHFPKSFIIASVLGILLSIVSSLAFGWLDGRWVSQPDLVSLGEQLQHIPEQLGSWSMVEQQQLDEKAQKVLRCYGSTLRVYQNSETGEHVTVAVLLGPRGPIAVHTPEICYSGQGVQAGGERQQIEVQTSSDSHHFWQVTMLSQIDLQPALEVVYGWSDGSNWQAAERPRFWLTDRLYKLQVAGPPAREGQASAGHRFLHAYLPHLQPQLVSAEPNPLARWMLSLRP